MSESTVQRHQRHARTLARTRKLIELIDSEKKAIAERFESRYVTKPKGANT